MVENFTSSTIDPVFFDTAFLLDEVGRVRFAVHNGEPVEAAPSDIYGPSLTALTQGLVRDGLTYDARGGVLATKWGLATVAVGTVVPFSKDFAPRPERSRLLILSKAFDGDVVQRLSEDFLIADFRLVDAGRKGRTRHRHHRPVGKGRSARLPGRRPRSATRRMPRSAPSSS